MKFFESEMKMLPGVHVSLRCTLLQLKTGAVLISPIDFSEKQIQEIRAIAPVTDLIAPSKYHHSFLDLALRKFPGAILWAAPGLKEKCPTLPIKKTLTEDVWPYKNELDVLLIKGAKVANECVFFHHESRTLFVTDLVFNMLKPQGLLSPIFFRMFKTYKRFAVSKMWTKFITDRAVFAQSMEQILSWDFDRIVMCHGSVVETGGKAALRDALIERDLLTP